jgi:site-specific DNA recombinase
MNEAKIKSVAYIRISSTRQIDNESPETQRESIRKYAEANGLEIVNWFEDIAKSGKNTERDGLQELLRYCLSQKGEIKHWIVYNMKRASRDIDTYSTNVRTVLKTMGITVRSATEPAVTDTKEGRFMENLLVMLGQLDNEGKAEVTIDNMRSLALQGYWQHPPIVGYEPAKIPNDLGKLRPSLKKTAMATKVQEVLVRFSAGDITKAELTRYASKSGLRSRYDKKLGEDSINRLLKNPVYAGYVSDKFTEYKLVQGKHESIIDKSTYDKNQRYLHGASSRKGERHDHLNPIYPLRGLLHCINCRKKLYSSAPQTGNGNRSPRYHCARKSCVGKVPSVKAEIVHEEFVEMLKRIRPSDEILKTYKHILVKEANSALENLNSRISNRRDKLDELSIQRSKAIDKLVEGSLTKEEKDDYVNGIDGLKVKTVQELEGLEHQQTVRESDIDIAINVMESVHEQWAVSELDLQHRFQSMLFPRGVVYDSKNHKFGTSEISELYRCSTIEKAPIGALSGTSKNYLVAGPGLEPGTSWL